MDRRVDNSEPVGVLDAFRDDERTSCVDLPAYLGDPDLPLEFDAPEHTDVLLVA